MNILLKFTFKSILEKKFRTFLILISITLSVALTLSSFAIRDVTKNAMIEVVKKYFGTANVMVTGDAKHGSYLVRLKDLGQVGKMFDYQVGAVEMSGLYISGDKKLEMDVRGYSREDLNKLGNIKLIQEIEGAFTGKAIYISSKMAKDNNWQLGSSVEIILNSQKHKVRIVGIGSNSGALESNSQGVNVVMPSATLRKLNNLQDRYYYIVLKSKDGVDPQLAIKELAKIYDRYKVDEPIPWSQIQTVLNRIIIPFVFMLLLVLATAIFIIYTAFKVIAKEKLPVLGTFRSIGATKRTVDLILLGESVMYGLIGSGFGILLGKFILSLVAVFVGNNLGGGGDISKLTQIGNHYYLLMIIFGVVLSLGSSTIPILQVSKLSVRDIVLGFTDSFKDRSMRNNIIGALLLFVGLAQPFTELKNSIPTSLLATICLCAGIMLLIPLFTTIVIKPLGLISRTLFGNIGALSLKNINGNKSILNNISLLAIGISSIVLINILSATLANEVSKAFDAAKFDIYINVNNLDKNTLLKIKNTPGVDSAIPVATKYMVDVKDKNGNIGMLETAASASYFDYWDEPIITDKTLIEENLGVSKSIVLSQSLKKQLEVQVGEYIEIEMRDQKYMKYLVVGTMKSVRNNGNVAVITEHAAMRDANLQYSTVLVKSEYAEQTMAILERSFKHNESFSAETIAQLETENMRQNAMIVMIFQGFSVVAMLIGTIGILNNFIVSLMSRTRSLAVMKSVGMSRAQTMKMLIIEALMCGLIGGLAGIVGGLLLVFQVNQFLTVVGVTFSMQYNPAVFISALIGGAIIAVISSLLPAGNVARANIVSAIKYE